MARDYPPWEERRLILLAGEIRARIARNARDSARWRGFLYGWFLLHDGHFRATTCFHTPLTFGEPAQPCRLDDSAWRDHHNYATSRRLLMAISLRHLIAPADCPGRFQRILSPKRDADDRVAASSSAPHPLFENVSTCLPQSILTRDRCESSNAAWISAAPAPRERRLAGDKRNGNLSRNRVNVNV